MFFKCILYLLFFSNPDFYITPCKHHNFVVHKDKKGNYGSEIHSYNMFIILNKYIITSNDCIVLLLF